MSRRLNEGIKLLKAGETGFGFMIENDSGYIDPNDIRNKEFVNEVKKVSEGGIPMIEPLVVTVVLQKWGVKNRNGRIYPERILKAQANAYNELIKNKSALGEADHPESSIISIDRVSHNITKIWWEGKTLMGEMQINTTTGFINMGICSTKGDEVANMLRHGWRIGVSSRGVGTLEEDYEGNAIVQDDFELIGWDVVTAPSTPGSWIFANSKDAQPFTESRIIENKELDEGLDKFLLD
jgi:hypothetical protein